MNIEYMETLAREYNKQLRFGTQSNEGYVESCIQIVEKQLDIINTCLNTYNKTKAMLYLESLKRCSLKELNCLKDEKCIPECKERSRTINSINTLVNLEIDLFTNLDYMKEGGMNVNKIIDNETRSLALMGVIK